MLPAAAELWSPNKAGEPALGLCCTEEGLFLGRTLLIEKRGASFAVRPRGELERLLPTTRAGGFDQLIRGLRVVKSALDDKNLCLAQIAAVQLRVPPLPDFLARAELEAEDVLINVERGDDILARAAWDPAEHPCAGVPPNPGWFAPTDDAANAPPLRVAQEEERAPEDMLDPLAPVRQAQWDAAIARLREIDPNNPNLVYLTNPSSAPSREALARLNTAIEAAAIKRVTDKLMPNGVPIGLPGSSARIRQLPGDLQAAKDLFEYLRVGGQLVERPDLEGLLVRLPGNAGFITFRMTSRSNSPALDVNVPGIPFKRIHFK